jgi:hypothetical protein
VLSKFEANRSGFTARKTTENIILKGERTNVRFWLGFAIPPVDRTLNLN